MKVLNTNKTIVDILKSIFIGSKLLYQCQAHDKTWILFFEKETKKYEITICQQHKLNFSLYCYWIEHRTDSCCSPASDWMPEHVLINRLKNDYVSL